MNNFFEKAFDVRNQYFANAVDSERYIFGSNYDVETFDPCNDPKIEILSQLVSIYFIYDGNIPNKFSIKLSKLHGTVYLKNVLNILFNDLEITYKIDSVSHNSPFLIMYNRFATAYTYDITLLK